MKTTKKLPVQLTDDELRDRADQLVENMAVGRGGTEAMNAQGLGEIGVRDPEYPCAQFETRDFCVRDCPGDGHYLCRECTRRSGAAWRAMNAGSDYARWKP